MIVDAWVTRASLSLGNLDLVSSTYNLEGETGIEFGQRTWRRNMVNSPFVHGSFPVTQVMENSTLALSIRITSNSQANLATAIAALVDAFSQFEYEYHIKYDDTEWAWLCYAADVAVSAQDERFAQYNVNVKVSAPRSPIPISGGI